eukprot:snap_masked-scaffold_6-processed-gene-9.22-mRNA-1 protein AED:1.00 eAED:1.00 QI:0/0/0/0/1/1/2/0/63
MNLADMKALVSYVCDNSFDELAFKLSKDIFSDYRKYIDTRKKSMETFEVVAKKYIMKLKNGMF